MHVAWYSDDLQRLQKLVKWQVLKPKRHIRCITVSRCGLVTEPVKLEGRRCKASPKVAEEAAVITSWRDSLSHMS